MWSKVLIHSTYLYHAVGKAYTTVDHNVLQAGHGFQRANAGVAVAQAKASVLIIRQDQDNATMVQSVATDVHYSRECIIMYLGLKPRGGAAAWQEMATATSNSSALKIILAFGEVRHLCRNPAYYKKTACRGTLKLLE
jgi:hypothetical protein